MRAAWLCRSRFPDGRNMAHGSLQCFSFSSSGRFRSPRRHIWQCLCGFLAGRRAICSAFAAWRAAWRVQCFAGALSGRICESACDVESGPHADLDFREAASGLAVFISCALLLRCVGLSCFHLCAPLAMLSHRRAVQEVCSKVWSFFIEDNVFLRCSL